MTMLMDYWTPTFYTVAQFIRDNTLLSRYFRAQQQKFIEKTFTFTQRENLYKLTAKLSVLDIIYQNMNVRISTCSNQNIKNE